MNKKASEKINGVMFVLFLIIIAGGLTVLMGSYVNTPVDVRSYESQILYDRLMNCFAKEGFLRENVLGSNFDVFSNCSIDRVAIEKSNLYFEFSFINEAGEKIRESFKGGDLDNFKFTKDNCAVYMSTKTQKVSWCFFRNETYLYSDSNGVKNLKIVGWVASDNTGVRHA